MENEEFLNKNNRYIESDFYKKLEETNNSPPKSMELFFSSLLKVTYSSKEEDFLKTIDVLTTFLANHETLEEEMKMVTINNVVKEFLPILNSPNKNKEKIKDLVSNEYQIILENFEKIGKTSTPEIASKCEFACDFLTSTQETGF